jgi:hypothetical protein
LPSDHPRRERDLLACRAGAWDDQAVIAVGIDVHAQTHFGDGNVRCPEWLAIFVYHSAGDRNGPVLCLDERGHEDQSRCDSDPTP